MEGTCHETDLRLTLRIHPLYEHELYLHRMYRVYGSGTLDLLLYSVPSQEVGEMYLQHIGKTFRLHNNQGYPTALVVKIVSGRGNAVRGTDQWKGFLRIINLHTNRMETVGVQCVLDWISEGSLREESV